MNVFTRRGDYRLGAAIRDHHGAYGMWKKRSTISTLALADCWGKPIMAGGKTSGKFGNKATHENGVSVNGGQVEKDVNHTGGRHIFSLVTATDGFT
jgi:hypothetical protein